MTQEDTDMDEAFGRKVREELIGLSIEDIRFFGWLCVIRSLPFLGAAGHFNYWKKTKKEDMRQAHLLAVFRALDAIFYTVDAACSNVGPAYDACANAAAAVYDESAITDAAYAAYIVVTAAASYVSIATYSETGAITPAAATATAAATVAFRYNILIEPLLFQDIEKIRAGKRNFDADTTIYGEIWSNFLSALDNVGCNYWSSWFGNLFEKSFTIDAGDKKEIVRRLIDFPEEFMGQGVASATPDCPSIDPSLTINTTGIVYAYFIEGDVTTMSNPVQSTVIGDGNNAAVGNDILQEQIKTNVVKTEQPMRDIDSIAKQFLDALEKSSEGDITKENLKKLMLEAQADIKKNPTKWEYWKGKVAAAAQFTSIGAFVLKLLGM